MGSLNVLLNNERVIQYNMSNWLQRSGALFIRSLTKRGMRFQKPKPLSSCETNNITCNFCTQWYNTCLQNIAVSDFIVQSVV